MLACQGNLKRVQEELEADEIRVCHSTLARFVKQQGLGKPPRLPVGKYDFGPGEESQFDTSPHDVTFRDEVRRCQCASLVYGYSRMLFIQYYPRFTRFESKVFLTEALCYFGGACGRCIVDNTNLVILHGTGPGAIITPEMEAFARRYEFVFQAHRVGDANRSGKVERPFRYIETNFLVKRTFTDFDDLNRQARDFCDRNNHSFKRHLRARPVDLFATEQLHLRPLPPVVPEVYQLFQRIVDLAGYVHLHGNDYSAPWRLIGERMEIRESLRHVRLFHHHREIAVHDRLVPKAGQRSTDPSHRPPRGEYVDQRPVPQESKLREVSPALDAYVSALRSHCSGRGAVPLRRLYRMCKEYPTEAFQRAVAKALHYGLYDMERLERMILRCIAGEYFQADLDSHDSSPNPNKTIKKEEEEDHE